MSTAEHAQNAITTKDHLTSENDNHHATSLERDDEAYCDDCGARVTVAKERSGEYGHALDCQHHIYGGRRHVD
jgi:hypothetical protein